MPESLIHDQAVDLLKSILSAWAARVGGTQVMRNLAVRWDEEHPKVGVDPDVSVFRPPPPHDDDDLTSVRTWLEGHTPPLLAIEVVSDGNPHKDYVVAPDKYAASGTQELWVFDPKLAGPTSHGGPFRLQIWERDDRDGFARVYAGDGPARSRVLAAHVVVAADGHTLRIADDSAGSSLWLTVEETERKAKEAERSAKEAALARVAELEARLAEAKKP